MSRWLPWAILAAWGVLHFFFLDRYPVLWNDQAMYAELAITQLRDGKPRAPSMGETGGIDRHYVAGGTIHLYALGICERPMQPSIRGLRLPALISGLFVLAALFALGKAVGLPAAGYAAAAWFGLSDEFYRHAHEMRAEMMLLAFGLWALVFLLRGGPRMCALAGLLAGLALEVHMNALLFIAGLALAAAISWRLRSWPYFLGLVPGVLLWLGLHILPDPSFFAMQWREWWAVVAPSRPFPLESPVTRVISAFWIFRVYFWEVPFHYKAGLAALLIFGCGATVRRRGPERIVLWAWIGTLLAFVFFTRPSPAYYGVLFIPLPLFLAARAILAHRRGWIVAAAAGVAFLFTSAMYHHRYRGHSRDSYYEISGLVRSHLRHEAVVLGPAYLGYGLDDVRFRSTLLFWCRLSEDGRRRYGTTLEEILARAGVEYVVYDRQVDWAFRSAGAQDVPALLAKWELLGVVQSPFYGDEGFGVPPGTLRTTRIYRIPRIASSRIVPSVAIDSSPSAREAAAGSPK